MKSSLEIPLILKFVKKSEFFKTLTNNKFTSTWQPMQIFSTRKKPAFEIEMPIHKRMAKDLLKGMAKRTPTPPDKDKSPIGIG